jgi:hypothetical protein
MSVRAKMFLNKISDLAYGNCKELHFNAQYDETIPEDQRFCKATPTATATFLISNQAALEQFTLGKCYYLDFTEAP